MANYSNLNRTKITILFCLGLLFATSCKKDDDAQTPHTPIPEAIFCEDDQSTDHYYNNQFQEILDKYVQKGLPGISAAIFTPEEGLWLGTGGMANITAQEPTSTCNTFFSGSVAKMYTVCSAMKLFEEGQLDLDAPISNFLSQRLIDSLPNAQTATIRQLMNHTAGIPDHDDSEGLFNYVLSNNGHLPSAEDQLSYIFNTPANFEAGTDVRYSSAHTLTLSLILDQVTGEHHSKLVTEKIIDPLDLQETYYKNESTYPSPDNLINGYLGFGNDLQDITPLAVNYCMGCQGDAGMIATALDYYQFIKGLFENKIVSSSILTEMMEPQWAETFGDLAYGYGLGLIMIQSNNIIEKMGHSGQTAGGLSHVYYYPESGAYVVLLTNTFLESGEVFNAWAGDSFVAYGKSTIMGEIETIILD